MREIEHTVKHGKMKDHLPKTQNKHLTLKEKLLAQALVKVDNKLALDLKQVDHRFLDLKVENRQKYKCHTLNHK